MLFTNLSCNELKGGCWYEWAAIMSTRRRAGFG